MSVEDWDSVADHSEGAIPTSREGGTSGAPPVGRPPPEAPPPALHLGDASLIWPPFILLALATIIAVVLTRLLADSLRGGWFSMEDLGYFVGGAGYALFAALFLWCDALLAAGLPQATWRSRRGMWWQTVACALLALFGAAIAGGAGTAGLASWSGSDLAANGVMGVAACAVVVAIVSGAIANVRARRRTRVDPRAIR